MRLLGPTLSVVSADQDFVNVYLARRFLVPDGLHLCIDAQAPNPLPDRYFDAVYCQDAFHYVRSKKAAVAELKRVVHPDALWIFPHLHNRLCHNLVPGLPLSPDAYLECFALPRGRLFSESELLRGLSAQWAVDLTASVPPATLDKAPNLTFVSGGDELWDIHRDFPGAFCRHASTLQANPIYGARPEGNGMRLERRWPNPVMARECIEADTVLPQSCHLSGDQMLQLRTGWTGSAPGWLEDLVARFVLVPLPHGYARNPAIRVGEPPLDVLADQARA
jgi:SAM-dependent methyltransferase